MAKKKLEQPRREFTRRQHSRWKQQKRRQRLILGFALLIVVAVLSVIGIGVYQGWYVTKYKPLHEVVIEVNETEFDMEYYIKILEHYTQGLSADYVSFMAGYIVELIEREELVKQEATALGITVSDEEVEELMNSQDPPLEEDYRDLAVAQLLMEKMRDEYFDAQVPQSADQRHIMAMFLESEAQANDITARLEGGEDFGELAGELSLDSTTKEAGGDLGWCPLGILPLKVDSTLLEESAFALEVGVLSPPIYEETKTKHVGYWLIKVMTVDDSAEPIEAYVWAMLLGSEQEVNDIIARLEAGEAFAALASEYSLHTDSKDEGGELVVHPGEMTMAFDEYVFGDAVELETVSPPIRDDEISSTGGYWLIKVVESEANRQIDDETRLTLKTNATNRWVEEIMADPENILVSHLDDAKMQWAISYVIGG